MDLYLTSTGRTKLRQFRNHQIIILFNWKKEGMNRRKAIAVSSDRLYFWVGILPTRKPLKCLLLTTSSLMPGFIMVTPREEYELSDPCWVFFFCAPSNLATKDPWPLSSKKNLNRLWSSHKKKTSTRLSPTRLVATGNIIHKAPDYHPR